MSIDPDGGGGEKKPCGFAERASPRTFRLLGPKQLYCVSPESVPGQRDRNKKQEPSQMMVGEYGGICIWKCPEDEGTGVIPWGAVGTSGNINT